MKHKKYDLLKVVSIILLCLSFLLPISTYFTYYKKDTINIENSGLLEQLQDFDIILTANDDPLNYYIMKGEDIDYSHAYIYLRGKLYSVTFRWLIDRSLFIITDPKDIKAFKIYIYRLKDKNQLKELYTSLNSVLEKLEVIKNRTIPFDYRHIWKNSDFFSSEGLFCIEFALLPYIEAGIVDISKLEDEPSRDKIFNDKQWSVIEIDSSKQSI